MEDDVYAYLVVGIIGFVITIFIIYAVFRWVFSVKRQLWNQKMQIELLVIIVQKLGVDTETEDFKRLKKANRGITDLY